MENSISKLTATDYRKFFEDGLHYTETFHQLEEAVQSNFQGYKSEFYPINLQRMKRNLKQVKLSEEWLELLNNLTKKQNWLVITELWCGDSAQLTPIFHLIEEAGNGIIDMRLVYRDEHPLLMDAHLTNGGRSIPKLLILDDHFNLLHTWGPRPAYAMQLVKSLKSNPDTAASYAEVLHKWYADDKGESTLKELEPLFHFS